MNREQFRDVPKTVAEKADIKKVQEVAQEAFAPLVHEGEIGKESLSKLRSVLFRVTNTKGEILSIKGRLKKPQNQDEQQTADAVEDLGTLFISLEDKLKAFLEFEEKVTSGEVSGSLYDHSLMQLRREISELGRTLSDYSVPFLIAPYIRRLLFKVTVIGSLAIALASERTTSDMSSGEQSAKAHVRVQAERGASSREGGGKASGMSLDAQLKTSAEEGAQASVLDLLQKRTAKAPVLSGKGPEGKYEQQGAIGYIEFLPHSKITDPLWATDYTGPTEGASYREISSVSTPATGGTEASVTLEWTPIIQNKALSLPVPVGYTVADVRINGTPVSPGAMYGSILVPKVDETSAQITYSVVPTAMNLAIPPPALVEVHVADARRAEFDATARAIQGPHKEEALKQYFKEFTYVVSSDLQRLIDTMPGSLPDKIGGIRAGDCDTLAAHGVSLFQSAHIKACIANGFLSKDNAIEMARGHAKLVYEEEGGAYSLFETTASVRDSFLHVRFQEKDYAELQSIASKVGASSSHMEVANMYREFGERLREILAQPEYAKARTAENLNPMQSPIAHKLQTIVTQFMKGMEGQFSTSLPNSSDTFTEQLKKFLTALSLLISALVGSAFVAGKMKQVIDKKVVNDASTDIAKLWKESHIPKSNVGGEEEYVTQRIEKEMKHIYRISPDLEKVVSMGEALSWDLESRAEYLRLLSIAHTFSASSSASSPSVFQAPDELVEIRHVLGSREWDRMLSRLRADGDKSMLPLVTSIKQMLARPELSTAVEAGIRKTVDTAWESVKRRIVSLENLSGAGIRGALRHPSSLDAPLGSMREGDVVSTRGKKISSPDGDFSELSKYRHGDDIGRIDWRASARRDSLFVRRNEMPLSAARGEEQTHIALVIDVVDMDPWEFNDLAALFVKASLKKSPIRIESVEFLAFGQHLGRWGAEQMRTFVSDTNIEGKVKGALTYILTLQKKTINERFQKARDTVYHAKSAYDASLLPAAIRAGEKKQATIVVGLPGMGYARSLSSSVFFHDDERT
ncbi:MAG: hypothetical protein COV91_03000 [Candidatus Taylorbacteria bacterium CG11_big_fil_rev_8_21_14_0_20_46_11]|uniref:DUF58 domain-containing protein n=1 Tax=Candidatus Taylorbacteria bacterium CG11_big_fil_rev_8_21_14_0_20_46_11 TaxID=1975025 RepID=A0A2H0KBM8_9BACT|nr:MAG: hypothetical protein COV91_03000 [Candidatus Taylorbacteria bacterium CG11_big_fil_rev_8_21_14_0_20_46_11]